MLQPIRRSRFSRETQGSRHWKQRERSRIASDSFEELDSGDRGARTLSSVSRMALPNVVGAGGLQALVKSGLPVNGKRVVLAGTGPLYFWL